MVHVAIASLRAENRVVDFLQFVILGQYVGIILVLGQPADNKLLGNLVLLVGVLLRLLHFFLLLLAQTIYSFFPLK